MTNAKPGMALPALPSPLSPYPRRGSTASSNTSQAQAEKELLAQALDKIHISASRSDSLTTFSDFAGPSDPPITQETKSTGSDIVQQGLSGLYSKFKEVVNAVSSVKPPQDVPEDDILEIPVKKNTAGAYASARAPEPMVARAETASSLSTISSVISSDATSTIESLSGPLIITRDGQHTPQSSKSTSLGIAASAKMPIASRQSLSPSHTATLHGSGTKQSIRSDASSTRSATQRSIIEADGPGPMPTTASSNEFDHKPRQRREKTNLDVSNDLVIGKPSTAPLHIVDSVAGPGGSTLLTVPSVSRNPETNRKNNFKPPESSTSTASLDARIADSESQVLPRHSLRHSSAHNVQSKQMPRGVLRVPGSSPTDLSRQEQGKVKLDRMKRQVLSKEFWMKDETCKECFLCATAFTAFRRKHHCRTCGCIFDSRCTSIISGQGFGVQGSIRVCKTCLDIINRRLAFDASGSDDDSADEPFLSSIFRLGQWKVNQPSVQFANTVRPDSEDKSSRHPAAISEHDPRSGTSPTTTVPTTRMVGNSSSNRNSAIFQIEAPQISRPNSSRSLRSLGSGRPQSSGHKRHHSKSIAGRSKLASDDRAPFRRGFHDEIAQRQRLPAFHDDNIIDPELAAYMSDDSSADEQMSLFDIMTGGDLHPGSLEADKPSLGVHLNAAKKLRFRQGDKSVSGLSLTSRGADDAMHTGSAITSLSRSNRRRNISSAGGAFPLRSPRPRSGMFKGLSMANDMTSSMENTAIETPNLGQGRSMPGTGHNGLELNPVNMQHARTLLRQLLQDSKVPSPSAWDKALIPILLRCAEDIDLQIQNGDHMDIRRYVKLKKLPGGRPSDTSFVTGLVFTKNLALKSMPRRIVEPRIVVISFPIEYQRQQQQHFMSLQPVIEQEKEYLRLVVNRIISLGPHVVLTAKGVSGIALQYLADANIAVICNVKSSIIDAVCRCTQTQTLSSVDMLSLAVAVGTCAGFEVKTYVNNDYPGKKKSYVFLSGCVKELGCTIALRGAGTELLARVKMITEFMVYVIYNMMLEACLMRDDFIMVPMDAVESSNQPEAFTDESVRSIGVTSGYAPVGPGTLGANQAFDESEQQIKSQGSLATASMDSDVNDGLTVELRPKLISVHASHLSHDAGVAQVPEDVPMPTYYSSMVAKYQTKILSASPFVKFSPPYLLMRAREQERRLIYLKRLRDQDIMEDQEESEKIKPQSFQLIDPSKIHAIGQTAPAQLMEVLHAVHDAEYDKALHVYNTQTRQWESYIQGNIDLFDPFSHQNIVVLHSVTCTETKIPCVEPDVIAINFYDDQGDSGGLDPDCTLGQYIEDICFNKDSICDLSGFEHKMSEHHHTYVHDQARVTVFVETVPAIEQQVRTGDITMWSYCKVCQKITPPFPMSQATWKYSFGKYLELVFWGRGLPMNAATECPHDHSRDHIRHFSFLDARVHIHYDPIDLLEIVVPRNRITWAVERDLKLKNDIFVKIQERWARFIASVVKRLKSISLDSVLPDKAAACKTELENLTKKALGDQAALLRKLQDTYINSKYYEVIPLNVIVRDMLLMVGEWDAAFAKLEADFVGDKDLKQLTLIQLKKIFFDDESKDSIAVEGTGSNVDTEEKSSQLFSEIDDETESQSLELVASHQEEDGHDEEVGAKPDSSEGGDPTASSHNDMWPAGDEMVSIPSEGILQKVDPFDLPIPAPPCALVGRRYVTVDDTGDPAEEADGQNSLGSPQLSHGSSEDDQGTLVQQRPNEAQVASHRDKKRQDALPMTEGDHQTGEKVDHTAAQNEAGRARKVGTHTSPVLKRALSQPIKAIQRVQTGLSKLSGPKDTTGNVEPGDGTAGDTTMRAEKKLSDRLVEALKGHRKTGQSGIPRPVQKRKESKVSALAKHFEQLSREFERERIKDRKKREATLRRPRVPPAWTSNKAIVEVYDDFNEAVKEPASSEVEFVVEPAGPGTNATSSTILRSSNMPTARSSMTDEATAASTAHLSQEHRQGHEQDDEEVALRANAASVIESQAVGSDEASVVVEAEAEAAAAAAAGTISAEGTDDDGGASDAEQLDDFLPKMEASSEMEASNEMPLELPKHQKMNLIKMLTNFWTERSASNWAPLDYPVNASDHIFIDSDVVVREDEPSSLIAFALGSEDYRAKLESIRRQSGRKVGADEADGVVPEGDGTDGWRRAEGAEGLERAEVAEKAEAVEMAEAAKGEMRGGAAAESESRSTTLPADHPANEVGLEQSLLRSMGTHLKYQFREGSATMLCKIFYAEQFDALRRKCGAAERIVESLSRCAKWDSKGGKTKSTFLKTLDDRLVMKSLSPIETSAFLSFAPSYFGLMAEVLFHELPSVIAKMLGFFQIIIKNPAVGTDIKLDLLVMENLFYDRTGTRIFDLKGSMRNRKIQSTGDQNEVLLDENMVDYIYDSPLFAREHSKKLLRASVWNDTLFLARQNVMDYSLMVAVDAANKELVVGIVDCIRTYTWDKKLESWIKDRGFVGGGRNRPTVTSPKEYKSRFREAMARYILQAPNSWHQFGGGGSRSTSGAGGDFAAPLAGGSFEAAASI